MIFFRVATDEPDAGALLTAADDGAVASPVGDVVHAPNAKHNPNRDCEESGRAIVKSHLRAPVFECVRSDLSVSRAGYPSVSSRTRWEFEIAGAAFRGSRWGRHE